MPEAGTVAAPGAGVAPRIGAPGAETQPAPAGNLHRDGRLPALWALTLLEQQRQWQLSMPARLRWGERAGQPARRPHIEVERIREEVGTPGTLYVDLPRHDH